MGIDEVTCHLFHLLRAAEPCELADRYTNDVTRGRTASPDYARLYLIGCHPVDHDFVNQASQQGLLLRTAEQLGIPQFRQPRPDVA